MVFVTSRQLRDEIYRNFADFLRKKARENPENKVISDCLKKIEKE
jgi:hypothetical protein